MTHTNFAANTNISHYRDQLLTELDPKTRTTLVQLLVHEEDRLGSSIEQFTQARQHIVKCNEHITRLRSEILDLQRNGRGTAQAESLLASYVKVKELHEHYCERIRLGFQGSGL
jgi:hypothetical protein